MENLITHRPLVNKVSCRPNLHGKQIKVMFAYYPFNFDRYGEMRKSPHIPADELKEWIKLMKGTVLDAKYIQNTSTPSRPAPDRQVEAREGQTTDVAVTTEHVSKVLMSNNSLSDTALANIQDESKTMQRQLQTAIEATINTRITVHDKLLHAVTQKTRALELLINDQHQAALEHAKAADKKIMMLTEWIEKQKEGTGAAKVEIFETNEAIVWVWNEVQKLGKVVARKREREDDGQAEPRKKIKIED